MEILVVIFSWLLFGGATSYFAVQRGRDPFAWFMIGMLLGILGLILLFLLPPLQNASDSKEGKEETMSEEILPEDSPESFSSYETPFRLKKWFYIDVDHMQKGPFPLALLKKDWEQGKLDKNTFVWSEGMSGWRKVEEIPQLKEELY